MPSSAFHSAKHTPPQALEDAHIGTMCFAFEESLANKDLGLGLGLRVSIDIAGDKSIGGFVHRSRPSLVDGAQAKKLPRLPDLFHCTYSDSDSEVINTIDSGADLKAILEREYNKTPDLFDPSINLSMSDDRLVDMEICSTVSLKSFSRFQSQRQAHASWISFEGWTVDENSDHSTCSDMSLGGGLSLELPPTPVDQIHESKVLALMGFGNTKSKPTPRPMFSDPPRDLENRNAAQYKITPAPLPLPFFRRLKASKKVSKRTPLPLAPDSPLEPERIPIPTCTSEDIPTILTVYRKALNNIAENLEKHGSAFPPFRSKLARKTLVDVSSPVEVTTSVFGDSTNIAGWISPTTPQAHHHIHDAENVPVF